MTDKVQKILSEIATRKLCTMDEHMAFYNDKAKEDYRLLSEIEEIIKASQEEPKKCMYALDDFNDEDRKVTCDGCEEDCKYAKLNTMLDDALTKETKESWNERLDKKDYRERYKRIAQSESFKKTHEGISIGDTVPVEGEISEEPTIPDIVDEHFDEMLDPNIQYTSREIGIKAHAEDYSFNIESELFQQLSKEQQKLWRKEIEQACISGGYYGLNIANDKRYDEEEPVSTKDKLLALSDGRLHLGWIDDAKVVEFEECLMQFHKDMSNIPQGTDSLIRLKDTDGVLHGYSKKLMSIAKEEPVSEELEEEICNVRKHHFVNDDFDKVDLEGRQISNIARHFAQWQKENLWKPADGDDLPEIDREVIAILDYDFGHYKVVYAHRPNPNGWNGTNIDTGEKSHFEPAVYDKGGWNQPHVLYWLDARLPYEENDKEIEL